MVDTYNSLKALVPPRALRGLRALRQREWISRGRTFAEQMVPCAADAERLAADDNPLRSFFERRKQGRGIWKWKHYFDIYHRHLAPFRGQAAHIVEVGVYSGGSLEMWSDYFGDAATIHGVDIASDCRVYEGGQIKISIGDQADPMFWRQFKSSTPTVHVLIDDGGHSPLQQKVTLQEMLTHLAPGGVYICEDIHGARNAFAGYVYGLADQLNFDGLVHDLHDQERRLYMAARGAQAVVESISFYPFITVITKARSPVAEFVAPKHGTEWQPYLS